MKFFTQEARDFIFGEDADWDFQNISSPALQRKIMDVETRSFADYIRKYIYWKVFKEQGRNFENIKHAEYVSVAKQAFIDNNMINRMSAESIRKQFSNNSYEVKRKTVYLWAFGLNMSVEEVAELFRKGARMQDFHFRNPYEIICYYCLKKIECNYDDVERLMDTYINGIKQGLKIFDNSAKKEARYTSDYRHIFEQINDENALMNELFVLTIDLFGKDANLNDLIIKDMQEGNISSKSAKEVFDELIDDYKKNVLRELGEKREGKLTLLEEDDGNVLERDKKEKKWVKKTSIAAISDRALYMSISEIDIQEVDEIANKVWIDDFWKLEKRWMHKIDRNYFPEKSKSDAKITREDIITFVFLNYYNGSYESDSKKDSIQCDFADFKDIVNDYLWRRCNMQPFYLPNPYESFIAICIESEDPVETFKVAMKKANMI